MYKNMTAALSCSVVWASGVQQGSLSVPIPVFINMVFSSPNRKEHFFFGVIAHQTRLTTFLALQKMHEIALDL